MKYSFPAWKKTEIGVNTANDSIIVEILDLNLNSISDLRLYRKPGTSEVKIRLDDIMGRYVNSNLDWYSGYHESYVYDFRVKVDGVLLDDTFLIYNDWSYKGDTAYLTEADKYLTEDVRYLTIDMNPFTKGIVGDSIDYEFAEKLVFSYASDVSGVLNIKIDGIDRVWEIGKGLNNIEIYANETVECEGRIWTSICGENLYYVNLEGGISTYVPKGKIHMKDVLESKELLRKDSNIRFENEIISEYVLNTGLIRDTQVERLNELIKSVSVWFRDKRCNILNSEYEYKTYSSNGNKLSNTGINIRECNKRYNR